MSVECVQEKYVNNIVFICRYPLKQVIKESIYKGVVSVIERGSCVDSIIEVVINLLLFQFKIVSN